MTSKANPSGKPWSRVLGIFGSIAYVLYLVVKTLWLTLWTAYQIALGAVLVLLVLGILKAGEYFFLWDIRSLKDTNPATTSFIYAERNRIRDSLERAGLPMPADSLVKWHWLPLSSIPKDVQELTLVAEDAKFFQHQGFDLEQIEFAMVANHQAGKKARGASTITQQVAKNLYLTKDKEISRKAREAVITLLLEHYVPKERILEIYLNIAQFDEGVFGIGAAARHHYRKDPLGLTLDESTNLVALLPSPTRWDFRKPNNAFLQRKRLIQRNYALFKGIKGKTDSTSAGWRDSVFSTLSESLSEDRWKTLRSRPMIENGGDSAESLESGFPTVPGNGPRIPPPGGFQAF